MKTKFIFSLLFCFIATGLFAQSSLNNYKYVIVPKKFDFLKENNQYQLNALSQFLFNKYGFVALMEGEGYPEDMVTNRCLALKSNVTKDAGLFKTKLAVELKDCNDRVVFTSQLGESREKEYAKAYNEALREAFKSFEGINYSYSPDESVMASNKMPQQQVENTVVTNEIAALKAEIESLKKEKQAEVSEVKSDEANVMVEEVHVSTNMPVEAAQNSDSILYAQAIENGFQLVDSSPKVIYKMIKTGVNNVFLVEGLSAIIYKQGDSWVVEQHTGSTILKETLNIKF
ncbi:hypothetical protein [Aestuariivivens insulae]|uniref:hypothetical protein n=1 Tax=Aestuariivivens insulae TaxID=1621988 RepID=UPI001F5AB766|nr:hypothetical protein [Aestuariivivens insulae]